MAYCYLLRLCPSAFAQGHGSRMDALGRIEAMMCDIVSDEVLLDPSAQWAEMRMVATVVLVIVAVEAVVVNVSRDLEAR